VCLCVCFCIDQVRNNPSCMPFLGLCYLVFGHFSTKCFFCFVGLRSFLRALLPRRPRSSFLMRTPNRALFPPFYRYFLPLYGNFSTVCFFCSIESRFFLFAQPPLPMRTPNRVLFSFFLLLSGIPCLCMVTSVLLFCSLGLRSFLRALLPRRPQSSFSIRTILYASN